MLGAAVFAKSEFFFKLIRIVVEGLLPSFQAFWSVFGDLELTLKSRIFG